MPIYLRTFYRFFNRFSCCRATFSSINSELGQSVLELEAASHLLGAGVARSGLTCGILLGSLMSAGIALYGRYTAEGRPAWIEAAKEIAEGFAKISKNRLTCDELTGINFSKKYGFWSYIFSARWLVCAPLSARHSKRATGIIKKYLADSRVGEDGTLFCGERVIEKSGLSPDLKRLAKAAVSTLACGCGSLGQLCAALAAKILVSGIDSLGDKLSVVRAVRSELFDPEALYARSLETLDEFTKKFGFALCSQILGKKCDENKLNEILAQFPCSLIFS